MLLRRLAAGSATAATLLCAWSLAVLVSARTDAIPEQLTPGELWKLSGEMSEPNGSFQSDNLLSNELTLQYVIPEMLKTAKPGRVYMGVGPEQNFTYIAALKPAMVFIVDVRRGNLQLHLWYKALFEMSTDRADFVSRVFSKTRPAKLTATSTPLEIFTAYSEVPTSETLFKANLAAVQEHLTKKRGLPLDDQDLKGIEYVAYQFYWWGPGITYSSSGGGRGGRNMPTYFDLMVSTDADGRNRGYLANEDSFRVLKDLHQKNLLVPLVGNFGGSKAIRSVGKYIKDHGGIVTAFYLSNVEQYLDRQGIWPAFCENAGSLPVDDASFFIRSVRSGPGGSGFGGGFGMLTNQLGSIAKETKSCPAAR
ncbi:MAG: hypothetical protein ABIS06_14905 [Vicinamibacterales bacterium]